jgi:endonuclease YncB( thermonuclease family)
MKRFLIVVLLVACGMPEEPTSPAARIESIVDRVADGDSFRAGEQEIRLIGVNAPESDECHYSESRAWLTDVIEGERVKIEIAATDQFDRNLADVHLGDLWVNRELVAGGYALALSGAGPELIAVEEEARDNALGLWGEEICGADRAKSHLEITSVDFNPSGPDDDERVTLHNRDPDPVDLAGYVLRDESSTNRYRFPATILEADGGLTISTACRSTSADLLWCTDGPVWNNSGDTALLLDSFGRVVSIFRYP